jgi:hypothetical protein
MFLEALDTVCFIFGFAIISVVFIGGGLAIYLWIEDMGDY